MPDFRMIYVPSVDAWFVVSRIDPMLCWRFATEDDMREFLASARLNHK